MRTKGILLTLPQHYYATKDKITFQFSLNVSNFEMHLMSKILENNFIFKLNKQPWLLLYQEVGNIFAVYVLPLLIISELGYVSGLELLLQNLD